MTRIYSEYGPDVRIIIEGHELIVQKFVEYNDIRRKSSRDWRFCRI